MVAQLDRLTSEVYVEHVSGEVRIDEPEQVAVYDRLADRLWSVAVEGDEARAVIGVHQRRWVDHAPGV